MQYPWTKLQGSDLWRAAETQIRANGLEYHNMDHVGALYSHASRLGIPYSERLDQNIIAHDVLQHFGPGLNEDETELWLLQATGRPSNSDWAAPILSTKEHRPSEDEIGLALLDLADFTDVSASRRNTELLRREAATLAGAQFDQGKWLMGTMKYLEGLRNRILEDLPKMEDHPHHKTWQRIARGIAITMECAPQRYDPHPSSGIQRYTPNIETLAFDLADQGRTPISSVKVDGASQEDLTRAVGGIVWHGLAFKGRMEGFGPALQLTDQGRDWVEAMRAPEVDYPAP
ncbi:MAG: hypothetical protein ABJN42_24880 [Roseibium sp.]|uniref:hypothetical protein n=1 Tax=Roseibium sp. TaxID=1936156 RepID=UPI003297C3E5